MKWIAESGELSGELEGADIDEWTADLGRAAMEDPAEAGRMMALANEALHSFVAKRTMAECYARAVKDGFMLAPLYTVKDIAADKHLGSARLLGRAGRQTLSRTLRQAVRDSPTTGPAGSDAGTGPALVGRHWTSAAASGANTDLVQRRARR